ncbi:NAD(P)/FAD-dependent oxidoreductase [Niabella terrae]
MKKIGIIGAGISGLATAKAFLERGFQIMVFEKSAAIGGVWDKSRFYIDLTTQTTKNEYAYSDFPMPDHFDEWPTGYQMNEYLNNYASHFGLSPFIRCESTVMTLERTGPQWTARVADPQHPDGRDYEFDFVAVCSGTFNQPYMPEFPGMQEFREAGGSLLHSSEITDRSMLENKNTLVLGFAKSATDIATRAAELSKSSTLLYRRAQWKVPRFFANSINLKYLLFSRFSEAFFLPYRKTVFQKWLHSLGRPMVWMQWRMIEGLLKTQFGLKKCGLLPQHRIEDQISCSLGIAPEGFYKKIHRGEIRAIQGEIDRFCGRSVLLKDGQQLAPDMVIMGTGFRQTLPFLSEADQQKIRNNRGQFQLYRNILNPALPGIGFVGFNSSLFSTLTSEIAANWLATYVEGRIQLPSASEIRTELDVIDKWKSEKRPIATEFSGLCIAPFNFQHLDQLMRDMGLPVSSGRNPLYNFFKPINPSDYNKLLAANRSGRQNVPSIKTAGNTLREKAAALPL